MVDRREEEYVADRDWVDTIFARTLHLVRRGRRRRLTVVVSRDRVSPSLDNGAMNVEDKVLAGGIINDAFGAVRTVYHCRTPAATVRAGPG